MDRYPLLPRLIAHSRISHEKYLVWRLIFDWIREERRLHAAVDAVHEIASFTLEVRHCFYAWCRLGHEPVAHDRESMEYSDLDNILSLGLPANY